MTQSLKINGVDILFKWIFDKKDTTFVFINSLGTNYHIWDQVVLPLQKHGNILLMDKRGHGLSGASENTKGLDDFAADVIAVLDRLDITKCCLVGISVGGMIAQLLAYHHPQLVEKLILCDTNSKIGNDTMWNARIELVESHGLAGISPGVMKRWFSDAFREQFPNKIEEYAKMLESCSPRGYVQTCVAIRDADLTAKSAYIRSPTLCIVGSEDLSTTPEDVKGLSGLIKDSKFKIIPGSGHLPCVDNAEIVSKLMIDFIHDKL